MRAPPRPSCMAIHMYGRYVDLAMAVHPPNPCKHMPHINQTTSPHAPPRPIPSPSPRDLLSASSSSRASSSAASRSLAAASLSSSSTTWRLMPCMPQLRSAWVLRHSCVRAQVWCGVLQGGRARYFTVQSQCMLLT